MDFGPSQQMSGPSQEELALKKQNEKRDKEIEAQRIKNMRGRGGAASLLSAGNTNNNILG